MLAIRLEVAEINYEKCFENLIPRMVEDCESQSDLTEVEKLLLRLGSDAVPVIKKMLRYLDTDTRDQIFVWLLEGFQDMFVNTANKQMQEQFAGDAIVIGGFYAEDQPGPGITLYAAQVRIDFEKLVNSPALGGVIGGAAKLALRISKPEKLEKKGIRLLSSDLVKPLFISALSDSLEKAGLILAIGDVELVDDSDIVLPPPMMDPSKDEGLIPDEIEDRILDGIAAWLKDSL